MAKQMTLAELEEGGRKLESPPAHTSWDVAPNSVVHRTAHAHGDASR
jgi:hypothetical protein